MFIHIPLVTLGKYRRAFLLTTKILINIFLVFHAKLHEQFSADSFPHPLKICRENQFRFLPAHVARSTSWSWLPYSRQTSAEVRLLEQFKRVPTTATTRKLMRKYLEFCWALPFYG